MCVLSGSLEMDESKFSIKSDGGSELYLFVCRWLVNGVSL